MTDTLELPVAELRHQDGSRFNIASESRSFDCKFIEPGIVSYRDVGGKVELLRKETLDRCMASVVGNPLTIGHVHVTADNRTEVENGIVSEWKYNSEDAWYYVSGTADTEEAKEKMRANGKPSCGYRVLAVGPGGVYHGIRYDQEILDIQFNHLAIVERPRYEDCEFRLNSFPAATQSNMNVFKFLKRLVTRENGTDGKPVDTVKTESRDISGDTEVEIDGKKVRLNELFATYLKETEGAFTATPEDALEVSGKVVTMGELASAHRANVARENALKPAAPAAAPAASETEEAKASRLETEAAAQRQNEADKSAFLTLHAARSVPKTDGGFSTNSGSLKEKCEAGAKRY